MNMPWDASDARKRYRAGCSRAVRIVRELAASAAGSFDREAAARKARRAIDTCSELVRFMSDDTRERELLNAELDGIGAALRFAGHTARANFLEANTAELRRLDAVIYAQRAAQPY